MPPASVDQVAVHHEVGIEDDHLVAGVDHRSRWPASRPAEVPEVIEHLAVGMVELGVDRGLELARAARGCPG